jgi:acetyltransferase-like isoleucine patch superfamily enzyme
MKNVTFKKIGKDNQICQDSIFSYHTISIGDDCYIGPRCVIQSYHGEIEIGDHVMIGPGVNIHGGNHITNKVGVYMNEVTKEIGIDGKIIIEDDVWIGANSIILMSVVIGEGSVIGAGSIVTKDVKPYSIVAGSPAKIIKMRFTDDELKEHKRLISLKKKKY